MTMISQRITNTKEMTPKINLIDQDLSRGHDRKSPFYFLPAMGGSGFMYQESISFLSRYSRVYSIDFVKTKRMKVSSYKRIDRLGTRAFELIRKIDRKGPYALVGWGVGGVLAFETARQMEKIGCKIALVAMIEAESLFPFDEDCSVLHEGHAAAFLARDLAGARGIDLSLDPNLLNMFLLKEQAAFIVDQLNQSVKRESDKPLSFLPVTWNVEIIEEQLLLYRYQIEAIKNYRPHPVNGKLIQISTLDDVSSKNKTPFFNWRALSKEGVEHYALQGDRYSILKGPNAKKLTELLNRINT